MYANLRDDPEVSSDEAVVLERTVTADAISKATALGLRPGSAF